ncbi:acyl-CoA dehydrogenase type 2 [Streptomyces lincolnensis]|uniref:Acyl-CoA dehydrogenase type 2 n=1 Tax=Streptomyces lincolnensis TaxID=1915 RepID=A0A1B1MPQ1_STRLN|nr:acyl-CoA dehydrogenase family protein [Streptomyces lincolnensis]ANS70544.1 acyl-CoA dehydrogenase type 2 [Streptomyces lincolnensis]
MTATQHKPLPGTKVRDAVVAAAAEILGADTDTLRRDGRLHALPAFNSFRMVDMLEQLEERLGVEADPARLTPQTLRTVDGLCRLFAHAQEQPAAEPPPVSLGERLSPVRSVVREHAAATDREASFPEAALKALRRSGLLGLLVPKEYGGLGGTTTDLIDVVGELARECLSVAMIYVMHCQQAAVLVEHADDALRAALLPRVADGTLYLGSVTTDPGNRGRLLSVSSGLRGDDTTLHVDRDAPVVTGGTHADGFLISMRALGASSPESLTLVYADREQLRITVTGDWNPLGMRATHSVPMRLTGDVPARQTVGRPGGFRDIALATMAPLAHLGWAACWLGAADGALARVVRHLRTQRDRVDLHSDLLLHRLSRVRQRLDTVHALIRHATQALPGERRDLTSAPVQLLLNTVKLTASEQCPAAVDELVQLMGMFHGYLRDSPLALERTLRDLRSAPLNYSNDRLHAADGALVLMDQEVRHAVSSRLT